MRHIILSGLLAMMCALAAHGQGDQAVKVTNLSLPASGNGQIAGSISAGQRIPLRWAESSQVACFPGTRFEMFDGNHVLYRVEMPAASSMKIQLKPKNGAGLSLYALRQGSNPREHAVPPNVQRAISCEASYPIYANLGGGRTVSNKDDGTRKIEFISVGSPYSILIGVAGARGATAGDYDLMVSIAAR